MKLNDFSSLIKELSYDWNITIDLPDPEDEYERQKVIITVYYDDSPLVDYPSFCKGIFRTVIDYKSQNYMFKKMISNREENNISFVWQQKEYNLE